MGGRGSGRKKTLQIDEAAKKLIMAYRQRGYSWSDIAKDLGFKSTTPLEDFRRENPDFDSQCLLTYGQFKMVLHDRFVEAAMPKNGPPVAAMANRIAERYGIIAPDKPSTAVPLNSGQGIQVTFVEPSRLPSAPDVIDVKAD
jgi:hypothetical protein